LKIWETIDECEDWRTKPLQCRVIEFHFPLDARRASDAKILALVDRVLKQRSLADAGVSVHHEDCAMTSPRGIQQPPEHRDLSFPAE